MKKLLSLAVLLSSALATFAQPATVPGVKEGATDVYQLWVNGGQNGFYFDSWGGTQLSEETIDGKLVEKESNFAYSGSNFTNVDVYDKQYFHLDVYPMQDMSLAVVMINSKSTGGNEAEKGYQINDLKANEWNSIDIPVEYYVNRGNSMSSVYQVKLVSKVVNQEEDPNKGDGFENADGQGTIYIGNYYFYGKRDLSGETTTLASLSLDASIVGSKGTFTINATPLQENGRDFKGDVTYTISDGATLTQNGNQLTVTTTQAGDYTITATSGDATVTTTLHAIDAAPAPTEDAADVLAYYSDTYNAAKPGISEAGWNWGYSKYAEITLADNDKALSVSHAGTFGLNLGAKDITSYTKLHADIYASKATSGYVLWEPASTNLNSTNTAFNLKEGWNSVDINIAGNTGTEATWLQFYIGGNTDADKIDFVLDNVYISHGHVETPFTIGKADYRNFTQISGPIKEENLAEIKALDVTAIDISNATLAEGITKIETANPNTIIAVKGTVDGNNITSEQADQLTDTKNLVVRDAQDYIHPVKQLDIQDGYDAYTTMFLSTGDKGYKYTRTIGANKYVSTMVPKIVDANELTEKYPALTVYNFDVANSTATEVKFNKGTVLTPAEPHIIHNNSAEDVTLTIEGTGDLNLNYPASAKQGTTVQFNGTYAKLNADGSQYGLQNSVGEAPEFRQIVAPAVIPSFRAYITGISNGAKASFNDGDATGINTINVSDIDNSNAPIYNISGQRVSKNYKGLVIMNGKKYINK